MCVTCGCGVESEEHQHDEDHETGHVHVHRRQHGNDLPAQTIALEREILAKNDQWATRNRECLEKRRVFALNLIGSPGAGKTTLLETLLGRLASDVSVAVIEGDQATHNDAARIRATGCPVVQINTGAGCHLDAQMVGDALESLDPAPGSVLFIENVGNLVCPALFDLGERAKAVVLSVTEGEDKPLKYPHVFGAADLLVLTKIDLLPHLDFELDTCLAYARRVNPRLRVFMVSARQGQGMDDLCGWMRSEVAGVG